MSITEGWVVVYASRQRAASHERSLVLQATGIVSAVADGPRHSAMVLVSPEDFEGALEQLRLYDSENRRTARPSQPAALRGYGTPGVSAYVLVLLACYAAQNRRWAGIDWLSRGALDGMAVRGGEWWRLVTALTLHADPAHISANLVFGVVFGAFASQYLGSGIAWALILLAAAAGNALDLYLLPADHRAIGASTAVFAALGLSAGFVWASQSRSAYSWARRWAPLVGAAVLLTWLGTGDADTDTVAHLTGFVAGLAAGALFGHWPRWAARDLAPQLAAGAGVLGIVAACWGLAITG